MFLEMENIWKVIVKERLRRNCESSLTKYSEKFFGKNNINKVDSDSTSVDVSSKIPIIHQYRSRNVLLPNKLEDCKTSIVNKSLNCAPLTMILIENENCKSTYIFSENSKENKKTAKEEQKLKWPGVLEVMESYQKYSKGIQSCFNKIFYIVNKQ